MKIITKSKVLYLYIPSIPKANIFFSFVESSLKYLEVHKQT